MDVGQVRKMFLQSLLIPDFLIDLIRSDNAEIRNQRRPLCFFRIILLPCQHHILKFI